MKASVFRLCSVAVFWLLTIGCAGASDKSPNALTDADLQGTYDLNTDAMTVDLAGDGGFNMISETLEIDANTLTFAPTFAGMGSFTLTGNRLVITDSHGNTDVVQATLSDTGNTLTLIDEIDKDVETFVFTRRDGTGTSNEVTEANLQGAYDLDAANTTVKNLVFLVAGELDVAGNVVTTSLTFSQTRSLTLAGSTITLTDTDGDTTVLRATLSHDGNTLTLTFVENRDTFVYERREPGARSSHHHRHDPAPCVQASGESVTKPTSSRR